MQRKGKDHIQWDQSGRSLHNEEHSRNLLHIFTLAVGGEKIVFICIKY
jgi:hypothetical protein